MSDYTASSSSEFDDEDCSGEIAHLPTDDSYYWKGIPTTSRIILFGWAIGTALAVVCAY